MENIFENFTISILKLNKLVTKIKLYEMEKFGLKSIHMMCLYYLERNEKGLTAGELGRLTLEDKAAISRAVATLHEKGYAEGDLHKYNGNIKLTDEGLKLAKYLDERAECAVTAGKSGSLPDEHRHIFYSILAQIGDNLQHYYSSLTEGNE